MLSPKQLLEFGQTHHPILEVLFIIKSKILYILLMHLIVLILAFSKILANIQLELGQLAIEEKN